MSKPSAKDLVSENLELLQEAADTADLKSVYDFVVENSFNSAAGWTAMKKAFIEIAGFNYDKLRQQKDAKKITRIKEECQSNGMSVVLYFDAKASNNKWAVCGPEGEVVWYGIFFDDDYDFTGEQSTGEMSAAKKAVWLAGKVREKMGYEYIHLLLYVDAEWLTYANQVFVPGNRKGGGKARQLGYHAKKQNVYLTVSHIPGEENPADRWTVSRGYKHWSDNELSDLLVPHENSEFDFNFKF